MSPIEKSLTITNKYGLHARASTRLAQVAMEFQSSIRIRRLSGDGSPEVDVKSVLGILSLGAEHGEDVQFTIDGPDAEQALLAIEDIFERRFDEE